MRSARIVGGSARIVLGAIVLVGAGACASLAQGPATLVLRGDVLARVKARVAAHDPALEPAMKKLLGDAAKQMQAPIVAVTDKSSQMPPSGNRHDYYSLSPYWWPDPAKPDGLPYIRRDGETNPESKRDLDRPRIGAMVENVNALALAYYLTGDQRYAEHAGRQLRAFFIDTATMMMPHLRYGQLVRGNPKERGSAIIDTHNFIDVVDDAALLVGSKGWSAADHAALRSWMRQYNTWLKESPNGKDEWDAPNNHGSWYAAQTATLALFSGDTAMARGIIADVKARIDSQVKPDGQQPVELERTRSFHYSGFNADALSRLAELGRWVGVDLWHFESTHGGSIRKAIDHLASYVNRPKEWPGQQIDAIEPEFLVEVMRRAQVALGAGLYSKAIPGVAGSAAMRNVLLYPDIE
ncbi:MAG: alginate lyase family protein [Gemmatimonadaceae bacterium]